MNKIELFLAQAEPNPGSNIYVIGAFEKGITIYRQQVRALNLIYCLHESQRIPRDGLISVIGGGVAGVTAAAAALALGYRVYLFEKHTMLLHLQRGCDTRWVHPYIYDWPRPGSEMEHAGLPLLSWRANTSAEVAQQILNDFAKIRNACADEKLRLHRGATVEIQHAEKRVSWTGSMGKPRSGEIPCDAIIFAVGFGYEKGVEQGLYASYWRNDSLSQPIVQSSGHARRNYLVSGTGDGGLIDALRIRLNGFNQGRIIRELFDRRDGEEVNELRAIVSEYDKKKFSLDKKWLFDQYSSMEDRGFFKSLDEKIDKILRTDTHVIVNGNERFSDILNLDKISTFNTLLIHRLRAFDKHFEYKQGQYISDFSKIVKIRGKKVPIDETVLRHGTSRAEILECAGLVKATAIVRDKDGLRSGLNTGDRLWPAAWWGDNAQNSAKPLLGGGRTEFVSPSTSAMASIFALTLSNILSGQIRTDSNFKFRLTLHRLTSIAGTEYFQQITPYGGTRSDGRVGRIFDTDAGLIGLVANLGQPICVNKDDEFQELWYKLKFAHLKARDIDDSVESLFACPFFSSLPDNEHVNLVLFADSGHSGFFSSTVLQIIYTACRGFVRNVEEMIGNGDLTSSSDEYPGYRVSRDQFEFNELVSEFKNTTIDSQIFAKYRRDLLFRSVRKFDITLKDRII